MCTRTSLAELDLTSLFRAPAGRMKAIVPLLASLVLCCSFTAPAHADAITILSVTGNSVEEVPWSGGSSLDTQYLGFEFVLGQAFKDVSIAAPGVNTGLTHPTAWLTSGIGPTATPSNVIASAAFYSGPNDTPISTPLLSDLDLSPGTYFFLISVPDGESYGNWPFFGDPTVDSLPTVGVSGYLVSVLGFGAPNPAFPPASTWSFDSFGPFVPSVIITAEPVAEPSTLTIVGTGLLALLARRKRQPTLS
jgi:PEP-CTERM motif